MQKPVGNICPEVIKLPFYPLFRPPKGLKHMIIRAGTTFASYLSGKNYLWDGVWS